ncbi:MAG: hypothetical protein ACHQNA_07515, partial [Acidimicrobiales bacterium]
MTAVIAPERSHDELHDAIGERHRALSAAHAALLVDIGEHDRVEAWRRMAARSEEDYLVRYHQLAWATAKDWTREARVLARHPELAAAYADGTLSMDKLNAACRLAAARDAEADKPMGPFDGPVDPEPSPTPDPDHGADPSPDPGADPSPNPGADPGADPDPEPTPTGTAAAAAELLSLIEQFTGSHLS